MQEEKNIIDKGNSDEIINIISNVIGKKAEEDVDFFGVDSITFIKLIIEMEGRYNFEFEDDMLLVQQYPTVGSFVDYVKIKIDKMTAL